MSQRVQSIQTVDRQQLLKMVLLPAVATLGAMAVCFAVVGGLLLVFETFLLGSIVTKAVALVVMYLLPHFLVGTWIGTRTGLAVAPPVAAGLAPIVFLFLMLGAFGGPPLTPLDVPVITLAAIAVWSGIFACGLVVGERVLDPRLREWRDKDEN